MNFFQKIRDKVEVFLPMTIGSLLLFCFVIYLIFLVGRSVWKNYQSDKDLEKEEVKITEMSAEIKYLENQINYLQTFSFREKQAREKLGYKGIGERVVALPIDSQEEKSSDSGYGDPTIKVPNYRLWWRYFFG